MEKTVKQLFSDLGIETKRNHGSDKVLCPKCSHTRKNKKDPCLSIDIDTGEYNCHNDCGFHGRVKNEQGYTPKPKEYVKPVFNNKTDLCDGMVKYFQGRCISQKTIQDFKISESVKFMPQLQSEVTVINFNYFRDEELVNVKYRPAKKAFMMVKDAELIFYGLNNIKESTWCIITEGEIDCLSFYEAGITEVVSVPNGASKGNANLEYLDNCISYFENKNMIILATDNDEAGISLRDELARRLGHDICHKVDFKDCKDANEYLKLHGPEKLREVVSPNNLIEFPITGVITADMIWDEVEWLLENGLERGDVTEVMYDFDKLVSFVPGQLMALTGIPNHGKSPFALLIMCALSLHHGWKWGVCSPEHKPLFIFLIKICELLIGKRARPKFGFSDREKSLAKAFISEYFYFIEPDDDDYTLDNILDKSKVLVKRKGIRGLLIDPWNKLEHNMPKGDNETMYISKELDKIIRFDQRNSVFTIVVAHPTKIRKNLKTGLFEVPNLYDIAGCHDDITEVLTDKGWKLHKDLDKTENVACFDLEHELIMYMRPSKYHIYDFNGDMYHFKGRSMDILVTPEHRMVVKPHWKIKAENGTELGRATKYINRDWQFVLAKDVSKSPLMMPKTGKFFHGSSTEIDLDGGYDSIAFFSFIGWYVSEGWHTMGSVAVCQNDDDAEELKTIISTLKLEVKYEITNYRISEKPMYRCRVYKRKHPEFVNYILNNCGIGCENKKLPDGIWKGSFKEKYALFSALIQGDGSISGNGYKYHTASKQLGDDVSRLAFELGFKATMSFKKSTNEKWKDKYVVYICNSNAEWLKPHNHKKQQYSGKVYCLTVPTGSYVTRRNGKIAITGNSANWFNKVDIGVCFYRNFVTNRSEVYVQKIKHEHLGEQGMCELKYNINNSRFCNLHGDYDNTNWLMPKSEQVSIIYSEQQEDKSALVIENNSSGWDDKLSLNGSQNFQPPANDLPFEAF